MQYFAGFMGTRRSTVIDVHADTTHIHTHIEQTE